MAYDKRDVCEVKNKQEKEKKNVRVGHAMLFFVLEILQIGIYRVSGSG
jgi:hypothetical protein